MIEEAFPYLTNNGQSLNIENFKDKGFKSLREYKSVEVLPPFISAYHGIYKKMDYELRFYNNHQQAFESGKIDAKLVTGKESNGEPQGVSPDMARALAKELNVDVKLITFNRPGELADAISQDAWDIGNIANEPARAKSITFSLPYTTIESTFLIRNGLNIKILNDVDKKGIKIGGSSRAR